ncbi:MAG: MFS transporter [Thermoleophilia bacterium]|nr:MFS transporter [Thermoleophilia bacterium]
MSDGRRGAFLALAPVYLSVFLFVAGNSALSILIPVYLSRRAHLGAATIGAVVGVVGIASLAARLPVGLSYSAARGRVFLLAGCAMSAVAFALVPFVTDPVPFAGLMALNGLGWSVATTAQLALLVARPPGGVSTAAAMGWFSGATGLGNMVGGVLGGGSADGLGLRTTFFVLAVTPLLGALLMVRGVASSEVLDAREEGAVERAPWSAILRLPVAVWIGVLVMFFINGLNALTNTFQPILAVAAGLSVTQVGGLSSIRSWASSSSRFGSGPLFSRFDPAGLTLPLVVVGTLATCLIPSVIGSFLLQIPLFALAGLSRGLLRVTGSADAFDSVRDDDRLRGLTSALLYGGLDLGKIVLPFLGGAVAGLWGVATMFRVVPAVLLLIYLGLALPARRALTPEPARR